MKKLILLTALTAIIFFTGFNGLNAQNIKINPIPSFNCPLTGDKALFNEMKSIGNTTKEKRDMDVVVSSTSHGSLSVFANVWIVKNFGTEVLGPYIVNDGEQLSVGIDNEKWGVVVKSDFNVVVSVWIE